MLASTHAPQSQPLVQGRKLYDEAYSRYNAYIEQVLSMMIEKRKGDLMKPAKEAGEAMRAFEEYVDKNTTSRSFGATLPAIKELVEWGTKLVDFFSDRAKKKREELATRYKKELTWLPGQSAIAQATGS